MHGWLNTGCQKSKISPDAVNSHKCPRCHEPEETQEHILKCKHVGAHKKRYDLQSLISGDYDTFSGDYAGMRNL
jgi:hypothetical protein